MLTSLKFKGLCRSVLSTGIVMLFVTTPFFAFAAEETVTVWKSPACGCCQGWVDYLEDNGFEVAVHDVNGLDQIKRNLGITDPALHSCHTAKIGDYLVEGHVPVEDIRRMIEEKPDILGITAPGMPMLSPGMNSIEPQGYDVLQFDEDQKTTLYSRY